MVSALPQMASVLLYTLMLPYNFATISEETFSAKKSQTLLSSTFLQTLFNHYL